MKERSYKSLIVLTPSNNIKNVETLEKKEQFRLAEKTSVDTVTIVEKALEDNETLEKVVIVELPPRADSEKLAELTKYSNFILKSKVEKSKFYKNITIAKLDALYNHPKGTYSAPPPNPGLTAFTCEEGLAVSCTLNAS